MSVLRAHVPDEQPLAPRKVNPVCRYFPQYYACVCVVGINEEALARAFAALVGPVVEAAVREALRPHR